MSTGIEVAASKKAALDQLRFSKKARAGLPDASSSTSSSLSGPSHQPNVAPPSQSRDATVPSRFFSASSSMSNGTLHRPSSSSPYSPANHPSYTPYGSSPSHDVAGIPGLIDGNPWSHSASPLGADLLTSSAGYTNHNQAHQTSLRRPWDGGDNKSKDGTPSQEEGPPRKRVNRGPSQDPTSVSDSPGSPEIQRPGPKRRLISSSIDAVSTSSDESLPDASKLFAGPSKPRIVRDQDPSTPDPPSSNNVDHNKFIRFKLTMPGEDPIKVEAAWRQANGDVKKATELMSDRSWSPKPRPVVAAPKPAEITGRVKEIDEATKAQRAAAKEKGKKSLIYANRPALPPRAVTPPPPSKPTVDLTASSPIVAPRLAKRNRKMVVDSESEPDFTDSEDEGKAQKRGRIENADEYRALEYFNTTGSEALQQLTGCTPEQASTIIGLRPFESADDLREKLGQGKKKSGPGGISPRMFEDCTSIFKGYGEVDSILEDCERIGATLRVAIAAWTTTGTPGKGKAKEIDLAPSDEVEDGALSLRSIAPLKEHKPKDYISTQPSLLSDTVQLKEYQLLGVNWLNLLYRSNLSCILADEMGLGKTIQVISFFAHLKERGNKGPHLVVVPSSTLENWCREFARFAPSISIQTYYAGKDERPLLRQTLLDTQRSTSSTDEGWEVLITTYNLAQGDDRDRKFFRKVEWDSCVFDEGHVLKNFQSQRYQALLKFGSKWRLLLTGTPLQNNLQELVSLMNFILPNHFAESMDHLRAIFKVKGDSKVTLLSQERVSRAKKMMTPFVLRRRKDQVLKDLPKKTERIEWCEMTSLQKSIYTDALQRSRKTIFDAEDPATNGKAKPTAAATAAAKKKARNARPKDKVYLENSSNVLMDLRKAASHPMLFRTLFTDDILSGITKQLLKEPDFKKRGALFDLVKEDMTVMTDAELQFYCATYKSTRKYLQDEECYLNAGKVKALLKLLSEYGAEGRKVLIFSQFTQILDILQAILKQREIKFLLLTGSTPVDVRQSLVDEFTEDESLSVFLLSTKAGGMGINLTAASVVIMFDQDFNPHNDRQAQDRAYRIGQKRDVEVVKLISRGTIEEDMLKLGETKLALDEAVAGDHDEKGESAPEREMKTSLMSVLRQQFEKQQGHDGGVVKTEGEPTKSIVTA